MANEYPEPEEQEEGGQTTLIPKELCPGMKAGDKITLTIDAVYDDEYEVSYMGGPAKEAMPEDELDSMANMEA